jgi:hypothetical protein
MKKRESSSMKQKIPYAIIVLLVLGFGAASFFGYQKYNDLKKENQRLMNPQESANAEKTRIKSEVEKLVETPKDEEPIIATVTDVEKLKSQPFYADAQNGDKALFYEKAKKAILYRPSTNKIINTSTLEIKSDKSTSTKNTTTSQKQTTDTSASTDANAPAQQDTTTGLDATAPAQ